MHNRLKPIERKVLRSHSSEGQKAFGKPNALLSSEQGNLIRSSVFRNADPPNLRGSLLEGNKDHLLNQARSETEEQRLVLQDAQSRDNSAAHFPIAANARTDEFYE